VDKDCNLKDVDGIQMDKLYLVIIQDSVEEIASGESKSVMEGEKHHNLFGVGCENIFSDGGAPLRHNSHKVKVIRNEFADFIFIHDERLEKMRMRGCH
jgi:hypothetical protein